MYTIVDRYDNERDTWLSPPPSAEVSVFFLCLRVFHTAVRYGKRHVKLIETSAEERGDLEQV
jgi:hypothetical protein